MLFRRLDEASTARNAALMAERKAAEGCTDCADGSQRLARGSRRALLARAGGLAAAGLAVSLVDIGGVADTLASSTGSNNPLGGWIADPEQVAPAVLNSPAYIAARDHLLHEGMDVGRGGVFMRVPASHNPLGLETYSIVQQFDRGVVQAHLARNGVSTAVATIDGQSRFGAHFEGTREVGTKREAFSGHAARGSLPAGRLLPEPGARIQRLGGIQTVATAGADTCGLVCTLLFTTGCAAFCVFFGPVGGFICGIVFCGPAGYFVCDAVCVP